MGKMKKKLFNKMCKSLKRKQKNFKEDIKSEVGKGAHRC